MVQIAIEDFRASQTVDKFGNLSAVPSWANRKRCELCKNWTLGIPEDSPDGWGVKGYCNGRLVSKHSYCSKYSEVGND